MPEGDAAHNAAHQSRFCTIAFHIDVRIGVHIGNRTTLSSRTKRRDLQFVFLRLFETCATPKPPKSTVLGLTVSDLVQWPVEFFFPSVLPCPVPYDNKIELQIAPPMDAQRSAEAGLRFGVRELALAFTARHSRRPRSNTPQLHTPHHSQLNANFPRTEQGLFANDNPTRTVTLLVVRTEGSDQRESKGLSFLLLKPARERILIANLELEFLASHTKISLLAFSNRKKIAVFNPHLSPSISEPDDRCRARSATHKHISNRDKNEHSAFYTSEIGSQGAHAPNRDSRTTTRAAFRSTIPARPYAYR